MHFMPTARNTIFVLAGILTHRGNPDAVFDL
jgi:hypothetical protein